MEQPILTNEIARLSALRAYNILDTEPEPEYENVTALASMFCETPFSALTFIDSSRQWLKSSVGLGTLVCPRSTSFCAHTIRQRGPMIVPDTLRDDRFRELPYVMRAPRLRFYAGVPIVTGEGYALGALCVMDVVPRAIQAEQVDALSMLARQAAFLLLARKE
ncbi:MAG: GAF domain-containing protein [Janthinobacterium lividum]